MFLSAKVFILYRLFSLTFVIPSFPVFLLLILIHYFYDYHPCKEFSSFHFVYFPCSVLLYFKVSSPSRVFPLSRTIFLYKTFPLKFYPPQGVPLQPIFSPREFFTFSIFLSVYLQFRFIYVDWLVPK